MSYFDWNATAPPLALAQEAWMTASERHWANPSTPYRLGAGAHVALDEARQTLADYMQVDPEQVVFTSGATESNNAMIREAALHASPDDRIVVSSVEHPSVTATALHYWGEKRVERMPVTASGAVDLDWLQDRLRLGRPALVCAMAVNNETGVIQPVSEVLALCRAAGVPLHCDAVQWAGKDPTPGREIDWGGCAGITLSAHKFSGPKGVGCLILGREQRGLKVQAGGAQEQDSRAGTENVPGVLAMVAALQYRRGHPPTEAVRAARAHFEKELESLWPGEIVIHGRAAGRVWNTCSVALPGHRASRWISRLDRHGFQVSSGSACSTGKEGPSPVLGAMGIDADVAARTLRISSGWETNPADWDRLLQALKQVRAELDASGPAAGPGRVIEI